MGVERCQSEINGMVFPSFHGNGEISQTLLRFLMFFYGLILYLRHSPHSHGRKLCT